MVLFLCLGLSSWGQNITIDFSDNNSWVGGDSYGAKTYTESGWTFSDGDAFRETDAARKIGEYSWRVRGQSVDSPFIASNTTNTTYSGFEIKLRPWSTSEPSTANFYILSYSTDGGNNWVVVEDNFVGTNPLGWLTYTVNFDSNIEFDSGDFVVRFARQGSLSGNSRVNIGEFTAFVSDITSDHTITVIQPAGGEITPGTTGVDNGEDMSFTATAESSCYVFSHWVVDGVDAGNTNPYTFTNVTADHEITAAFNATASYEITATAGANGSISPSGAIDVDCGADQAFTITADSGYAVADVLVNGVSVGAVTTYTFENVTEDQTISATFMEYVGPCGFEYFENIPTASTSSYANREWEGNGGTWTATKATTNQEITGKAILLNFDGVLTSPEFTGGVGALSFKTKHPFAENAGNHYLSVKVNGLEVGQVSRDDMGGLNNVYSVVIENINISGDVIITIVSIPANGGTSNRARFVIDDLEWTCYSETPATEVTWTTDNEWSNITGPTFETDVIIEGTLTVGELNNLDAKSLTVNGALTIADGGVINLKGAITNNGSFIVENGGNLIQTADYTGSNNGSMTVKKNSSLIKHLDYMLWSSPVSGQGLQAFSPLTLDYRIYSYQTTTDTWVQATGNFEAGNGYMFRAPNDFVTTPYIYGGEFNGVANNGDITVNFAPVGVYQDLGNPYPSNMSTAQFWAANPGTATLYYWTNINAWDNQAQDYVANNWATFSLAGGVAAFGGSKIPTDVIEVGQGFVVETDNILSSVTFDNAMRTSNSGVFFRAATTDKHRIWLNFSGTNGPLNQILVGYMNGATNGYDLGVDSKMFGWSGSALYSIIDNHESKFTIQGRSMPFDDYDVVRLGLRANQAGTFTVSIADIDGIFAENQDIFLKDNLTQTQHNLKNADYTFVSAQGEFLNRFEIVYRAALSVTTPELDSTWVVYTQDKNFNIQTQSFDLKEVVVYDMLGRVIYQSAAEGTTHSIANLNSNGVMIVKITTADGKEFSRKVAK